MIVYIYNIGVDLYNGFNGLRHRINWTYFTVLDGLAHPLYSSGQDEAKQEPENTINKEDTTYAFTRGTEYYGGKK